MGPSNSQGLMSVTPDSSAPPTDNTNQSTNANPDLASQEFGTNNPGVPNQPVPPPMGIVEHNMPTPPTPAASSSGGGSSPFGVLGSIGSAIGSIFGLAQGGPIGLAQGGNASTSGSPVGMALGYLTGALHQQKYGGTPDTLAAAAHEVKARLATKNKSAQSEGFASGGATTATSTSPASPEANQLMTMQAMGLLPGSSSTGNNGSTGSSDSQGVASEDQSNGSGQASPMSANTANMMTAMQATPKAASGGFMGYAGGGPGDPQGGPPPLQPGQQFQGDGSVKGPGGPQDDAIPAKLSNGEFVISQPATAFIGVDKLNKLNEQGKQGYMQAMQQVQANQPGAQQGQPPGVPQQSPQSAMMPPPAQSPQPQQPTQQASGGFMGASRKNSGFAGL